MGYTEEFSGEYQYVTQVGLIHPSKHGLFVTWRMMNVRCYDTRHNAYLRYGGRGITVCIPWRWDNPLGFKNFLADVGDRPEGTTLDKINNDLGYSPENVKWATKREQQNNLGLSFRNKTGYLGIKEHLGRLEVCVTLAGKPKSVGIYQLDEFDLAVERYETVKEYKMAKGDEETLIFVASLDERTPTDKRLRINKTSQYYGVSWDSSRNKWRAMSSYRETENGPIINKMIGRFDDELEAYQSVLKFFDFIRENGYFKKTANKEFMTWK